MHANKYYVKCDGLIVAENMELETAVILCKALIDTYFEEDTIEIAIGKMPKKECK